MKYRISRKDDINLLIEEVIPARPYTQSELKRIKSLGITDKTIKPVSYIFKAWVSPHHIEHALQHVLLDKLALKLEGDLLEKIKNLPTLIDEAVSELKNSIEIVP